MSLKSRITLFVESSREDIYDALEHIVEMPDDEGRVLRAIGDGRGRVTLAYGLDLKCLPATIFTHKSL